jgi:hypothetical protein
MMLYDKIAERSICGTGVGRDKYLFFGSGNGGRATIVYSLIESCKLNIDPQAYPHYVTERIADHLINRIGDLLSWNVADKLKQPAQVTKAA